jgi:hypothetical protein
MKLEDPAEPLALPAALFAEINPMAEEEHRSAALLEDALKRHARGTALRKAAASFAR